MINEGELNMETMHDLLLTFIKVLIVTIVPLMTTYVIGYIKAKMDQVGVQIKSERARQHLEELTNAITAAVAHTSQTYVDQLKQSNLFTKDAHLIALESAKNTALNTLNPKTKDFLTDAYGDLNTLLETKIEKAVWDTKIGMNGRMEK